MGLEEYSLVWKERPTYYETYSIHYRGQTMFCTCMENLILFTNDIIEKPKHRINSVYICVIISYIFH